MNAAHRLDKHIATSGRVQALLRDDVAEVMAEVDVLRRLDRADQNGLNTLLFRNLFPTAGSGTNGSANQAARSDHTH